MAAQSSHFFYPICFRAEQPASRWCELFFRHDVESTAGTGRAGQFWRWPGLRRVAHDAALVEKTPCEPNKCRKHEH